MTILHTARLRLEPVTEQHYDAMHAMNSDTEVMTYLNAGQPETEEHTRAAVARIMGRWAEWGYSWWALMRTEDEVLVGLACLQHIGGDKAKPHGNRLAPGALRLGQGLCQRSGARCVGVCLPSARPDRDILADQRFQPRLDPDDAATWLCTLP